MKLERLEMERDSWIYNILWEQEHQTLKLGKGEFTHSTNIEDQQTQSPRIYSLLHPQGFKMAEDPIWRVGGEAKLWKQQGNPNNMAGKWVFGRMDRR